jgi:hypothetical protein
MYHIYIYISDRWYALLCCVYLVAYLTGRDFFFRLPQDEVNMNEPIEHHVYDAAYRRGLSNRDCPQLYSTCPFSLLDVFLSAPK